MSIVISRSISPLHPVQHAERDNTSLMSLEKEIEHPSSTSTVLRIFAAELPTR
jgi:hypothetical protein